jgi:uncharacterized protein (DUF2141 family)
MPSPHSIITSTRRLVRVAAAIHLIAGIGLAAHTTTSSAQSGSVEVTLSHPAEPGEVACALFRPGDAFPDESADARGLFVAASGTVATCTFDEVAPGRYAIAAFLDTNGNRVNDRNFVGMPTEPWGVSNNVRPRMRAPNFEEAAFTVGEGQRVTIEIELVK